MRRINAYNANKTAKILHFNRGSISRVLAKVVFPGSKERELKHCELFETHIGVKLSQQLNEDFMSIFV